LCGLNENILGYITMAEQLRPGQPEDNRDSEVPHTAAPVKALEKKLNAIQSDLLLLNKQKQEQYGPEIMSGIAAIKKEQEEYEKNPPTSLLERLVQMVNRMLLADKLERRLDQIKLDLNKQRPSKWEKTATKTRELTEKTTDDKKAGVEEIINQSLVRIEDPGVAGNEDRLQSEIEETVQKGERVVRGENPKEVKKKYNADRKTTERQRAEIFEEELSKALESKQGDVRVRAYLDDLQDVTKLMEERPIGREEQDRLYEEGRRVIAQVEEGPQRASLERQLEEFIRDVNEGNRKRIENENLRRAGLRSELGLEPGQEEFEILINKKSSEELHGLIAQAKGAQTHEEMERIKAGILNIIDDPNKASDLMYWLRSSNPADINALDRYQEEHNDRNSRDPEALREARRMQKERGRTPRDRDVNLQYQGFSAEEIHEMKTDPEQYLNTLLNLAHGKSTVSKSGERTGYAHKLQTAIMEISTYYKMGRDDTVFGNGELDFDERNAYWERILEMYRCRFGLITAQNQIGIESDIEKRTGILAYFGTRETGWFYRQWWYKLADLEIKQHGDLLNDLLNMGERFPEVERYLNNAKDRSNRWLEAWIHDFENSADPEMAKLAEYNLMNIFGREMTKDGVQLETILKTDRAAFLKHIKHVVRWGDGVEKNAATFGLSEQSMHTSYDFMRWDMSLSEADARNIHKDIYGKTDGFLYDPQTSPMWRVLLAKEYGGQVWIDKMIGPDGNGGTEKDPARLADIKKAWANVQKMSAKELTHQTILAETHWQKTKKAYRRGEYGAGPRSLMNFFDGNKRLGRDNLEIAKLFDKLNSFRSITTYNYLHKIKSGEFKGSERDWFYDGPDGLGEDDRQRAIDENIKAVAARSVEDKSLNKDADQTYMRSLSADYGRHKRDYDPSSKNPLDYGGIDIEAAIQDKSIARAQAQALAAMRSFEEYADRKSTSIRDHHLKGLGLVEMKHVIAEILEGPLKAATPGGALQKLYRKTLISEIFEFPSDLWEGDAVKDKDGVVVDHKGGQGDFWLNHLAERWGCGALAPDKNMQVYLMLMKQVYHGSEASYKAQRNLLYNTVGTYYMDVDYTHGPFSPELYKARFKNWLSMKRVEWYVIGPYKMIMSDVGDFFGVIDAYIKQFTKEITKGTDAEAIGKSIE
jgi:hypothetical protein